MPVVTRALWAKLWKAKADYKNSMGDLKIPVAVRVLMPVMFPVSDSGISDPEDSLNTTNNQEPAVTSSEDSDISSEDSNDVPGDVVISIHDERKLIWEFYDKDDRAFLQNKKLDEKVELLFPMGMEEGLVDPLTRFLMKAKADYKSFVPGSPVGLNRVDFYDPKLMWDREKDLIVLDIGHQRFGLQVSVMVSVDDEGAQFVSDNPKDDELDLVDLDTYVPPPSPPTQFKFAVARKRENIKRRNELSNMWWGKRVKEPDTFILRGLIKSGVRSSVVAEWLRNQ